MANAIEKWIDRRRDLNPFKDFSQMQESFDRFFDEFSSWKTTNGMRELGFSPSCEIAEEGANYILTFDLPGVKKDHVKVESENGQLIIHAERKEEKKSESRKKYLSEIYFGSYVRSFMLPTSVDAKKIDAKFENGVLTITVPKKESEKSKLVPVH